MVGVVTLYFLVIHTMKKLFWAIWAPSGGASIYAASPKGIYEVEVFRRKAIDKRWVDEVLSWSDR